jgi:hypothetical protein
MPVINIEGIGPMNFPDSMSQEDIAIAIQRDIIPQFPEIASKVKRTWGEAAADIGGSLTKGVGQLAQIPGQVAGLVTGEVSPTTGLQGLGGRLEQYGEELKSPTLKARQQLAGQKMAQAEGLLNEFGTAIKTYATDPMLATSFVAEQLPNLFGAGAGGLATRAAVKTAMMGASKEALEKTLPKAAVRGAVGTGAVMQGADIGTDTFDTVFKGLISGGMSEQEASAIALQKGRVAAIEAAGISVGTAFLPGGTAIERALVGKGLPGTGGFLRGAAGEALSEGIEEGGGAFVKNIGVSEAIPGTSLTKGVGTAAGLGALGGALFGGPAGAISGMREADRLGAIQSVEAAKARAIETGQEQEVVLQLPYNPSVPAGGSTYGPTPMVVYPDGTVAFASEAGPIPVTEISDKTFNALFAPQKVGPPELPPTTAEGQFGLPGIGIAQPAPAEQVKVQQEQEQEQVSRQMELPLEAQASLGFEAPVQPTQIPEEEKPLAPTGRLVTDADTREMKIGGGPEVAIRKAIIGKDLTDPVQALEVKTALEDYLQKGRSDRITSAVTKFIDGIKTPQEQLSLGLRRPYGSMKKPVLPTQAPVQEVLPDAEQPIEPIAGTDESSISEPRVRKRTTPTQAVAGATGRGVVPTGGIAGLPITGKERVDSALETPVIKAPNALNQRQQAQFEDAASEYLVAAKGKPEDTLRYVAADLYAKDNLTQAKRFFRGLSPEQQDVVTTEINRLRGIERKSDTFMEWSNAQQKLRKAVESDLADDIANAELEVENAKKKLPKLIGETYGGTTAGLVRAVQAGDLRAALNEISNDQSGVYNPLEKLIAKRILANKGTLPKIEVVTQEQLGEGDGLYNPFTDTIQLVDSAIDSHTVLHEATHGFLHSIIEKVEKESATNKGVTELRKLYDFIQENNPELAGQYGMESLTEFASELMSNRNFQAKLAAIPYRTEAESLFTAFIRAVLQALGISPSQKMSALASGLFSADRTMATGRKVQEDVVTGKETLPPARLAPSTLEDIDRRAGYSNVKPDPKQGMFKTLKGTNTKQIESGVKNFLNKAETMYFSSDAALQNAIRKGMEESGMNWEDQKRMMFMNTTSQALHPDAVAMQLLQEGGVEYEKDTYKWKAVKKDTSWQNLVKDISTIAKQYNVSTEQMSNYAHRAFIADRLKGLTGSKEEFFSHKTPAQIEAGLEYFKAIPELRGLQTKWNEVRKNAMDAAVVGGLYSESQAKELLDIMDYVPFFRMEQLEAKAGPKEYGRGLLDFAKGYKIRGSEDEVNNIFDNMERWVSYTVSRAVKNRTALNLYDAAKMYLPEGEVTDLRQDERVKREQNTIDLWENGQRKKVEFKDPLFIYAFQGNEPVTMPVLKAMSAVSNILRKNIVLNPLFSISQLSQDSVGAMFTSGLKNPFAIPFQVAKEFTNTLRGKSAAHAELAKYGAVGVRDYSAAIARNDAEIVAGLASPTKFQKFLSPFEKFAMASDNAVRQAVYNLTLKETGDKAAAIEKAFEIINFKRSGASGSVQVLKQVVPFFGAYLQAQNVAYKTIMGKSIAPAQKAEAQRILLSTSAKIAALGFIYAALCADDEDYQKMDPTIRDRHLLIPGTGFMLPIRPDVFILPKLAAEYSYQMITDQGFTDGKKLRRGMSDAVMNAILSPTVVPQVAKPALEVLTNYNFFTGRPLVGMGLENKITSEQFTNTTSELAKFLGKAGLIAPVNIDHLIKGYLGTTGGLMLQATSSAANIGSTTPTPEKSLQDTLASTPGLSTFFIRENGAAMKNDYYELRGEVDKAVATYNNMIKTGRVEEAKEFYQDKKELFTVKQQVNTIERQLTKLRDRSKQIYASTKMSSEEKGIELERIKQAENRMLANINDLRKRAGF